MLQELERLQQMLDDMVLTAPNNSTHLSTWSSWALKLSQLQLEISRLILNNAIAQAEHQSVLSGGPPGNTCPNS